MILPDTAGYLWNFSFAPKVFMLLPFSQPHFETLRLSQAPFLRNVALRTWRCSNSGPSACRSSRLRVLRV